MSKSTKTEDLLIALINKLIKVEVDESNLNLNLEKIIDKSKEEGYKLEEIINILPKCFKNLNYKFNEIKFATKKMNILDASKIVKAITDHCNVIKVPSYNDIDYHSLNISLFAQNDKVKVKDCYYKDYLAKAVVKEFYNQMNNNDIDNISDTELKQIVENVKCTVAKTNDVNITTNYCLRHLREFNWKYLFDNFNTLKEKLTDIFLTSNESLTETYHFYHDGDKLHYNMVKVTPENFDTWKSFVLKERTLDMNKLYDTGSVAFMPSLKFFDWINTDTWVAFLSNKKYEVNSKLDTSSIEMYVTMITSQNACFTSHSGIARSIQYNGEKHNRSSQKLHSFISKVANDHYHDNPIKKAYMITCPIFGTAKIIKDALNQDNIDGEVYIGSKVFNDQYKFVPNLNEKQQKIQSEIYQYIQEQKHTSLPIEVILKDQDAVHAYNDPNNITSFNIKDKNGMILNNITAEDVNKEFAWFFEHPYLYQGQNATEVLATIDLQGLIAIGGFNNDTFEYSAQTLLGDST